MNFATEKYLNLKQEFLNLFYKTNQVIYIYIVLNINIELAALQNIG